MRPRGALPLGQGEGPLLRGCQTSQGRAGPHRENRNLEGGGPGKSSLSCRVVSRRQVEDPVPPPTPNAEPTPTESLCWARQSRGKTGCQNSEPGINGGAAPAPPAWGQKWPSRPQFPARYSVQGARLGAGVAPSRAPRQCVIPARPRPATKTPGRRRHIKHARADPRAGWQTGS